VKVLSILCLGAGFIYAQSPLTLAEAIDEAASNHPEDSSADAA
jgi:hypothetical protein